ncbi:MAG: alpha/beta hydrolase [Eubacteriales bacterium]|nr:alpha/beta hydrolase [Eubacteriales bacterium]
MVFLVLLCLSLAVLLGGGYYAYRYAFYSPRKGREDLPVHKGKQYEPHLDTIARLLQTIIDRPCEFVSITSCDGLTLSGRYYHVADGAPLDIAFHGYRSSGLTDFCGGAELSRELGHNLLLVDQRAHGKSQGMTITFGIKERWDVLSWVDYALERFGPDTKILLYGISMGASTVLMASELPLPEAVRGIVADCPYSSPTKIILSVARKMRIPGPVAALFSWAGAKVYGGFDLREADPVRAVKQAGVPILLIHGESDGFVPCDMSGEIQRANPRKVYRCTFPGADHGISFLTDPDRYRHIVQEFSDKVLT